MVSLNTNPITTNASIHTAGVTGAPSVASSSPDLALWVAIIGVSGTLAASIITQAFQLILQRSKVRREDALAAKAKHDEAEEEAKQAKEASEQSKVKSDIAIWKQIKLKMDDVYWEVHKMRPGIKSDMVYVSYISPAHKELLDAANEVLKTFYAVRFNDQESQDLLEVIMKDFKAFVANANAAQYYRTEGQKIHDVQLIQRAEEADKTAQAQLASFDRAYDDIKELVRNKYGYHNIFT